MSPYANVLRTRQYVELGDELCELVNRDLVFYPHLKYASAQLFAGSILRNNITGKAVMANTIEMYGRKKSVDLHREPFGKLKDIALPTSLPPPIQTRYTNVWPLTLPTRDGPKLVIGTLSGNALVTSATRLDQVELSYLNIIMEPPSVGAITASIDLSQTKDSLATSIFLDKESITKALSLAEN
ncbi:hypothetical protein DFQ29_000698, partial [Apophysomyces sp. BC1021]